MILRNGLDAFFAELTVEKLESLVEQDLAHARRLDRFARIVERNVEPDASVEAVIRRERALSPHFGGRTVLDDRRANRPRASRSGQLTLFEE